MLSDISSESCDQAVRVALAGAPKSIHSEACPTGELKLVILDQLRMQLIPLIPASLK